jgi:hypothetical protein
MATNSIPIVLLSVCASTRALSGAAVVPAGYTAVSPGALTDASLPSGCGVPSAREEQAVRMDSSAIVSAEFRPSRSPENESAYSGEDAGSMRLHGRRSAATNSYQHRLRQSQPPHRLKPGWPDGVRRLAG